MSHKKKPHDKVVMDSFDDLVLEPELESEIGDDEFENLDFKFDSDDDDFDDDFDDEFSVEAKAPKKNKPKIDYRLLDGDHDFDDDFLSDVDDEQDDADDEQDDADDELLLDDTDEIDYRSDGNKRKPAKPVTARPDAPAEDNGFAARLDDFLSGVRKWWIRSDKKKVAMAFIILVLLITVIVLLGKSCSCGKSKSDGISDSFYDENAVEGFLPDMTDEDIANELDRVVEAGMFNVSIASPIEFVNGSSEGSARIENVPANHYLMSVDISLVETGETIYSSKAIKPGQYIEYIKLDKKLAKGEYEAKARFTAYDTKTKSVEGHVSVDIKIVVDN